MPVHIATAEPQTQDSHSYVVYIFVCTEIVSRNEQAQQLKYYEQHTIYMFTKLYVSTLLYARFICWLNVVRFNKNEK